MENRKLLLIERNLGSSIAEKFFIRDEIRLM
jgi:hypothetical protein